MKDIREILDQYNIPWKYGNKEEVEATVKNFSEAIEHYNNEKVWYNKMRTEIFICDGCKYKEDGKDGKECKDLDKCMGAITRVLKEIGYLDVKDIGNN